MTRLTRYYWVFTERLHMIPYDLAAFVKRWGDDVIVALLAILSMLCLMGCVNSPLALRSIVYNTVQDVTTEGKAESSPQGRDSINADKNYSDAFKADLPSTPDKEAK